MRIGVLIVLALCLSGMESSGQGLGFVRVFDINGGKIAKGSFVAATDSSLRLEQNGRVFDIPVDGIGVIKTKRSGGNNVAIGAAIGVMTLTFAAVVIPDRDTIFGDGTTSVMNGAINGVLYGTAIGALTIFAKKPKLFFVGGDASNLKPLEAHLRAKQRRNRIDSNLE